MKQADFHYFIIVLYPVTFMYCDCFAISLTEPCWAIPAETLPTDAAAAAFTAAETLAVIGAAPAALFDDGCMMVAAVHGVCCCGTISAVFVVPFGVAIPLIKIGCTMSLEEAEGMFGRFLMQTSIRLRAVLKLQSILVYKACFS